MNQDEASQEINNLTKEERDRKDLEYLRTLDSLRQDAGITAAMLRDGRARRIFRAAMGSSMNVREKRELVALRAVELVSQMNMFGMIDHDEPVPQGMLIALKAAINWWNPSVAEMAMIRQRLGVQ